MTLKKVSEGSGKGGGNKSFSGKHKEHSGL